MNMKEYIDEAERDLLHTYNRYQIVWDKGDGVYLYDIEGKKYLDFVSGIGVFALGYNNKAYNDALKAQIDKITHTSNYYYNIPAIDAARKLKEVSGMDRIFYTNSGAEAVEGAIKAAKKYAFLRDGNTDHEIIALNHSFHGRTIGALSVTGNPHYREAFEPLLPGIKALLDKSNKDTSNYSESVYEGYGVGGVAVVVKCLTDNKNRTISDVRHAFDKFGGSLGATGSVTYMFENKGVVVLEKTDSFDSDKAMELALELEALDCEEDEVFTVYCEPNASEVNRVSAGFGDAGYTVLSAEVEMIPQNYISLDEHQRETFEKMLAKLDESDDVQEVIHNLEE